MKFTTTRVVRLLAALLMLGAMLATSASPAGASSAKATAVAATSSHATVASTTAAASAQTLAAVPAKTKCTTFWCTHPNCHTYRCWFKYCHTWFCVHKHHIPPYGHHFVNRPPPKMTVKSTAVKQGGTLSLAVNDAASVRLSLVGSNKKSVSLGLFSTAVSTGLLSKAVKLPAGLSGAYSLVATDAVSRESSTIPLFIAPAVSKLKAAPATKLASAQTSSSNIGFSMAAVIGVGVLALAMLGSGSTMLLLGRRRRTWKARA